MAITPSGKIPAKVKRSINAKLNSDVDPLELSNGDYTARVNVEYNSDGEMLSDTPALGNKDVLELGSQGLRNQRNRIYIDKLFSRVFITLRNRNGQVLGDSSAASLPAILNNKGAIVNVFNSFPYATAFFNTGSSGVLPEFIDVELEAGYSDYTIEIADQDGTPLRQTMLFEAIGNTGVGTFKEIGSLQLNDATFIFATTQDNELELKDKIDFVFRIGSIIYVQVANHGLSTNDSVVIANCNGLGAIANGQWTITVANDDVFALNFSIAGSLPEIPTSFQGQLFINAYGVGMIGVQTYNENNDTYDFTKLIASKQFNFITSKQIDVTGEVNNRGYLIKYTDDYNPPRTFSYEGDFVDNGALQVFVETGIYNYDNLTDDIKNIVNYSQAEVEFLEQLQSGGSVPPANWRYAVRFITNTGSPSEISLLSNPVPTFSTVYNVNTDIVYGNAVGDNVTGKINRVQVTGITAGRFEFIELIGYNYSSSIASTSAVTGYRIRRERLDPAQEEIILEHNGNEPDTILIDASVSNAVRPDIIKVGSNRIIDNRLVYGKVTTSTSLDIREWVQTFKYSIKRFGLYGSFAAETFYEFFDPESTAKYVGYQKWEWYRFYVAAETKSGIISDAVFAFDVRFVTQNDYDPNEFESTNLGDRRDLTNDEFTNYAGGDDRFLYQYYLELNNVDWDYRINGVLVSELFNSIKIVRAERIKEVIADGVFIGAVNLPNNGGLTDFRFAAREGTNYFVPNGTQGGAGGGSSFDPGVIVSANPFFGSFYSPDIIFGLEQYNWLDSDELINFGMYNVRDNFPSATGGGADDWWGISGYDNFATQAQRIEILESQFITGQGAAIFGTTPYSKLTAFYSGTYLYDSPTFRLDQAVANISGNPNRAVFQALVFRRRFDKYGDRNATGNNLVYTGTTIRAGESSGSVFGGDVFHQQVHFRHVTRTVNTVSAQGFNIVSSNLVNVNLRAYDPDNPTAAFPINPSVSTGGFATWLATTTPQDFSKNMGYSIFNNVQNASIFDENSKDRGFYPTRKYWSQLSPNNSQIDRYREILPLDFQDSPNIYGEITHLAVLNGELFTYQRNMFSREFFNATGRLVSADDGSILIGDGSVLSRDGMRMTKRGTQHKWSVTLGYSDSGKDVIYWVDTTTASIMRFGNDGSQNLTQRAMYDTFFRNNIRFVSERFTPANGQGLHGVWDDIGKNYILTCRAWKDVDAFIPDFGYKVGEVVSFGTDSGIPIFYICIKGFFGEDFPPPNEEYWTKIDFSNNDYYNVWTLVFNEKKNGFTHHYTFYPKIYHVLDNRYFSPSPYEGEESTVYRHRDTNGEEIVFYGRDNEGYTEYVINDYPSVVKKFAAIGYTCLLKPFKVEVFSEFISQQGIEQRQTFMERDAPRDMRMRENVTFVSVKNNLDSQGRNNQNTAPMVGLFAKIRTYFKAREKQKINECVVAIRTTQRNVLNT